MLRFSRPTESEVIEYLLQQSKLDLSYKPVGATDCDTSKPVEAPGFTVDKHRVALGEGQQAFDAAAKALSQWKMFPDCFRLCWPDKPIEKDVVVGIEVRAMCFWTLSAARIIYTFDRTEGDKRQFGFGYGTLPGHIERGEERFMVEWNQTDNTVWYDLIAFSRPQHPLVWLGYPYARVQQAKFRKLSGECMQRAVQEILTGDERTGPQEATAQSAEVSD